MNDEKEVGSQIRYVTGITGEDAEDGLSHRTSWTVVHGNSLEKAAISKNAWQVIGQTTCLSSTFYFQPIESANLMTL